MNVFFICPIVWDNLLGLRKQAEFAKRFSPAKDGPEDWALDVVSGAVESLIVSRCKGACVRTKELNGFRGNEVCVIELTRCKYPRNLNGTVITMKYM